MAYDIRSFDSVQIWQNGFADYWGDATVEDDAIDALEQFCQMVGDDPDAIIGECLRPRPSGEELVMRTRARRKYIEHIQAFETQNESRKMGNSVRSFFIHNGVAMNPSIVK
ncbi:MAG: hypothetical protein FI707_09720 [SAR202 cluster bacterium]|nr:hypothetical protein [Chloroflexota bacterium]MDP6422019.1 hypothetical protein [SAR202 cluster bacterium]HAL47917.1 hypothetical protein [Dehalococcoidia bacterium]MDP6664879.1 hypothetical protein [SAR202 cluster bacterium]MDP6799802.1 hypothetical protein [SAR202 cluster bacterium]